MRVRLPVDLLQLRYAIVGVALRGAERRVAHQLLNITHIGPLVEQMRSKGVAQDVRRALTLNICPLEPPLHNALYSYSRECCPLCRDNQGRVRRRRDTHLLQPIYIRAHARGHLRQYRYHALFVALASNSECGHIGREITNA